MVQANLGAARVPLVWLHLMASLGNVLSIGSCDSENGHAFLQALCRATFKLERGFVLVKIVHVTNAVAPDKLGGLERYVRELAARSVGHNDKVAVVAKRTHDEQPEVEHAEDGVVIVRYSQPNKRNPFFVFLYPFQVSFAVRRAISSAQAQLGDSRSGTVYHAHFPIPAVALALSRKRYVYTCHAPVYKEILSERQGTYKLPSALQSLAVFAAKVVEAFVIRRASQIVTLSSFVRREVEEMGVSPRSEFALIPGGIDTEYFDIDESVARSDTTLFAARRLVERTGVEELVRAMPEVIRRHPGVQLRIAGQGPRKAAIESLIAAEGLGGNVILIGRIPEQQLLMEYRRATICVTPTKFLEGFGLSTAEALACGSPVVVTPIGANEEVVEGLPSGLVSRDSTAMGMADALSSLLADEAILKEAGHLARSHVHPRFSWPAVVAAHMELYTRAV